MIGDTRSLLLGLLSLALSCILYTKAVRYLAGRRFARQYGCKALKVAPSKDPFLALDLFFQLEKAAKENRFLDRFAKLFQDVGSTFTLNLMGDDLLVTDEPKNIQAVLATQFSDFDIGERRRQNSGDLLGIGVFNADGEFWAHSRALVRPSFTRKQVADLRVFDKHVSTLIDQLPSDGSIVNLQEFFFRLTLDTATDYLFGESSNCLRPDASETAKRFAWAFNRTMHGIAVRTRMGKFARLYRDPQYNEACQYVHKYVEPIIRKSVSQANTQSEKELGEEEERYVFLQELAKKNSNIKELRDQVLNILIAARDTSAGLMSSLFFTLSQRPDILAKVQEEVGKLGGRRPTHDDISDMSYLKSVIKETLRLYPPVPINTRTANKDTFLPLGGGKDGKSPVFIRKGRVIIYQVYSMHRRTDLWGPDAHEFKPERWETARPGFSFLPFNAGPRICPGQQFAQVETAYATIRLCQAFSNIKGDAGSGPWSEGLDLTCAVGQGVHVSLTRR